MVKKQYIIPAGVCMGDAGNQPLAGLKFQLLYVGTLKI